MTDLRKEAEMALEALELFDIDDPLWHQMPEFNQKDHGPMFTVKIHFRNEADMNEFFDLINQRRTKRKSYWHPAAEVRRVADKLWEDTK